MKINKINYKTYGKLKDQNISLSEGINVIYGENEAGKSTIFDSIKTLIYGFTPANRDQHPYTNWETNDISFSAEIETQQGIQWVDRQLKSAPKLTLSEKEGTQVDVKRNDALIESQSISEKLYDSIFHLTSEDLLELENDSWDHIQDKLISNFGMDYLQKPSEVIESLEKEIGALWRPTKRGNPLIRQYETEVRTLQKNKRDAMEQFEALERKEDQLEVLKSTLKDLQDHKKQVQEQIRAIREHLPIKSKLDTIDWLQSQIENPNAYALVESDALLQLTHLKASLEEVNETLDHLKLEKETLEQSKRSISEGDRQLHLHQESFQSILPLIHQLDQIERKMSDALVNRDENKAAIEAEFQLIFKTTPSDDLLQQYGKVISHINPYELKSNLFKYIEKAESNAIELEKRQMIGNQKRRENGILIAVSGLVIVVLFAFFQTYLTYIGWLPLLAMGYAGANLLQSKKALGTFYDLEKIKEEVNESIAPVKLPEYVWEDKSFLIINKIEKLSRLYIEGQKIKASMETLNAEKTTLQEEIENRLSFMTFDRQRDIRLTYNMFKVRLDETVEKQNDNEKIDIKIENVNAKAQQLNEKIESIELKINALTQQLIKLGEGDLENGIERFRQNKQLEEKQRLYQDELLEIGAKVQAYQSFEPKEEIDAVRLAQLEESLQSILENEKEELIQKTTLESEIQHIKENDLLDEIESQIMVLKDKIQEAEKERNRLMVLSEVIQFADDQFRKENQPDILKSVSHYLSVMTNQKYSHVMINDGYELQIVVNGEVKSLANAFSKGTISQLYFAFRLAVIEMISQPQETLPIVFDEALVNWDEKRFYQTMKLLELVSEKHQVIIFTCHEWLAERMGDKIIRLES